MDFVHSIGFLLSFESEKKFHFPFELVMIWHFSFSYCHGTESKVGFDIRLVNNKGRAACNKGFHISVRIIVEKIAFQNMQKSKKRKERKTKTTARYDDDDRDVNNKGFGRVAFLFRLLWFTLAFAVAFREMSSTHKCIPLNQLLLCTCVDRVFFHSY